MDLDDAVRLLRDVAEYEGDWRDADIFMVDSEADELRRAIRIVLNTLRWWYEYEDTVPSLHDYTYVEPTRAP